MSQEKHVYPWSKQDRIMHLLPAIPLIAFYIGSTYLLAIASIYLAGFYVLLWVGVNFSVAGICAGCPYRGGYCPGLFQLYFAPFLSMILYKQQGSFSGPRSFKVNLILLGTFGVGSYIFGFYWLFRLYWNEHPIVVVALLVFLILHMPLSFFILCPKCSYNDICPMANVHKVFKRDHKYEERGNVSFD
jgi:hypothetical protein